MGTGLKKVFDLNSGKYAGPGTATNFMSLEELIALFDKASLFNEKFAQAEMSIPFNLSMMTNKNELLNDKHINMGFVEFLEVLGRICEHYEMDKLKEMLLQRNIEVPDYKAKQKSGLDRKVESMVLMMMQSELKGKAYKSAYDNYIKLLTVELENPGTFKIKRK